jgi:hypothetical protein
VAGVLLGLGPDSALATPTLRVGTPERPWSDSNLNPDACVSGTRSLNGTASLSGIPLVVALSLLVTVTLKWPQ